MEVIIWKAWKLLIDRLSTSTDKFPIIGSSLPDLNCIIAHLYSKVRT